MRIDLLEALVIKYESEMASAAANIRTYVEGSVGIGEHPDLVEAVETQVKRFNEASELCVTTKRLIEKLNG